MPEDIRWMGGSPRDRPSDEAILKNIAICVDLSRSMDGEPIEAAKQSIRDFVNTLQDRDTYFALIGFGDKIKVVQELSNDPRTILGSIDDLKVKMVGRGTDASPLDVARSMLARPGVGIIVVLTDGIWGKRDKAVEQAMGCRSDNITISNISRHMPDKAKEQELDQNGPPRDDKGFVFPAQGTGACLLYTSRISFQPNP